MFRTVELSDPAYELNGLRMTTVHSAALGRRVDASFWVPDVERIETLLILLHGVYGSHWVWSLKGGVHRTAQRMVETGKISPMVIAMPSDGLARDGSGYLNWAGAEDVERWIVEEIPALARLAAPALQSDARIAITGLSMGGYGALRLGAKYPARFCAISAHSAFTDVAGIEAFTSEPLDRYLACGEREELRAEYWIGKNRTTLPELRFDCGVDDPLIDSNRALHAMLEAEGIAHEYTEFPGGHEWSYWQQHMAESLRHADHNSRKKKST
jgi:putative tributyrin esterase